MSFQKELVKDIYKLSSSFSSYEKYALVQQINRAAVSVASIKKSNISTTFIYFKTVNNLTFIKSIFVE
ncbi:MAG: four helix bundle protein [Bacteroidota bacterium]|nr:four helix bundle protein [Bacteroidota bacterium]